MQVITTPFEGLLIIEPRILHDDRGYFFESFNQKLFTEKTGFTNTFVQDNQARSVKNVLRGLHYQNPPVPQAKLIRTIEGTIWDVVVDIRKDSKTYGQWFGVELSAENKRQFLIPRGFAHGYSVLTDTAEILYKCDNLYDKASEAGISYKDENLQIDWKIDLSAAIISEKDLAQPAFADAVILFN